jgi:hypothetical protein
VDTTKSGADVTRLLRPDLLAMEGYEPIEPIDVLAEELGIPPERVVKLDGNENPYGPSPRALAALPMPAPTTSIGPAAAQGAAGPASYLVDEELVVAALAATSSSTWCCAPPVARRRGHQLRPTFGMYTSARRSAAAGAGRARREDFTLDLPGIEEAARQGAKVIFIASPNNPTGNAVSLREVEALLELGLLVVVDEAYVEFGGESLVSQVPERERLVIPAHLQQVAAWQVARRLRRFPPAASRCWCGSPPTSTRRLKSPGPGRPGCSAERVAAWCGAERPTRVGAHPLPPASVRKLPCWVEGLRRAGCETGWRSGASSCATSIRPARNHPAHQRRPAGAHRLAPAR